MKSNLLFIILCPIIIVLSCMGFDFCKESFLKSEFHLLSVHTKQFEQIIEQMNSQTSLNEKLKAAIDATHYATRTKTLYLSSDDIEKVFTTVAEQYDIKLHAKAIPNSVLHIATELYPTGGHTRVIERWIENSPEHEINSLLLTRKAFVPERLQKAIKERNGQILFLNQNLSDIDRALELRKMASQYEKIVLHIHMDDYLPLIAFGTNKFPRPVIFFNHADHRFWIGVSIADYIVDLREYGKIQTNKYRGSKRNGIIYLPIDIKSHAQTFNKEENKLAFGLPQDKQIIFSSGAGYKFMPEGNWDYTIFMEKVLKLKKDVFFVLVGPSPILFKNLVNIPKQNYKFFASMPNDQYLKCLSTADIVIDSMPMCGFLTLIDAISLNIPVLSLKTKITQQDFLMHSKAYVSNMNTLAAQTVEILNSKDKRIKNIADIKYQLNKTTNPDLYKQEIQNLYQNIKNHAVHPFKSGKRSFREAVF